MKFFVAIAAFAGLAAAAPVVGADTPSAYGGLPKVLGALTSAQIADLNLWAAAHPQEIDATKSYFVAMEAAKKTWIAAHPKEVTAFLASQAQLGDGIKQWVAANPSTASALASTFKVPIPAWAQAAPAAAAKPMPMF